MRQTVLGGLADRARQAQDAETLAALPVMWQRITSALPVDSKVRPVMLANVCLALLNRYSIARDLYDLDAAVSVGQQASRRPPTMTRSCPRCTTT